MRWDMAQTVEFMACKSVEIPIRKQNFRPKQFEIIDEDKRLVSGWATVEVVDKQGEIVPVSEMKKAMYAFMDRGGHVMFKHSNKPVGKVLKWDIEKHPEAGVYGIRIVAKIFDEYPVDDLVWNMIKQGKLKGFSIGATAKAKRMVLKEPKKGLPREVGVLHDLSLMEISLVEEPANPLALIEEVNYVAKGDDVSEQIDVKMETKPPAKPAKTKEEQRKAIERRIELLESMTKVKELAKEVREKASDVLFEILKMKREEIAKALDEELVEVMKPFGKWKDFYDCVRDMDSRGYSEESAKRICGKLQAELEHKKQERRAGRPKTDEERAMEHFGISPEEWEQLSEDEKRRYIERLPPRGEGLKGDDVEEEIGEWEPPKKPKNWTAFKVKYHVIKALERLGLVEKRRKTKPPKKWWDYCVDVVSEGNPDYTDEQVRAVCGSMWYHEWGLGSPKGVREHA